MADSKENSRIQSVHRLMNEKFGNTNANFDSLIRHDVLNQVGGLPIRFDVLADPPPVVEVSSMDIDNSLKDDIGDDITWGTGVVGEYYMKSVLTQGQLIVLSPLEFSPNIMDFGVGDSEGIPITALDKIESRLAISDYGMKMQSAATSYKSALEINLKAAMLMLGLDTEKKDDELYKYMNPHIYESIAGNGKFKIQTTPEDQNTDTKYNDITPVNTSKDDGASGLKTSTDNFLKLATNADPDSLAGFRFVPFYVNGNISISEGIQNNVAESEVAKFFSTAIAKNAAASGGSKITSMLSGAGTGKKVNLAGALTDVATAAENPVFQELLFQRRIGSGMQGYFSNPLLPSVVQSSSFSQSYSFQIRCIASGGDTFSIFAEPIATMCRLIPFVAPIANRSFNSVLPTAPLFISAYAKGVMNINRGMVTSMNYKWNPQYINEDGLPTEIDFDIEIVPMLAGFTAPDTTGIFSSSMTDTALVANWLNPLSSLNKLATIVGQNLVLTKAPFGLLTYFIDGKVDSFFSSVKNSSEILASKWNDFSGGFSLNEVTRGSYTYAM